VAAVELQDFFSKNPTDLGFSIRWLYIGEEAASEVGQGHLTMWRRGPGGRHPMVSLRRGGVRGGPGPPHHVAAWDRGGATLW
jgi:hypothetical protein